MAPSKQKLLFAYRLFISQQENGSEHQIAMAAKPGFVNLPLPQERVIANKNDDLILPEMAADSCWDCATDGSYRELMHSSQSTGNSPAFTANKVSDGLNGNQYETSYNANSSLFHHIPEDEDFRQLLAADHNLVEADVSVASLYW
eukprot:CAMPEP_0119012548 /NCGR_PEP_ID=MMETSP1176-20130426/6899_1 /TAXON_ID=265551 /ORGANISM="Synedropsis recta cf, Strain CCMP1620" /LENGTH=144 /DNA_ID=CAMNT_0006965531 /DNA_START=52 /DNA_END=483 /DNA_ORIENTATION=+